MMNEQRSDDARSLTLIVASGLMSALVTVGLVSASASEEEVRRVVVRQVEYEVPTMTVHFVPLPLSGEGRLYGRAQTKDGGEYTGFLRWDRNEGSWADLLDANKEHGGTRSGIRFGHVQRIDVLRGGRAELRLRSGQVTEMSARSSDLGSALRALTIESHGGTVELGWGDLASVEFEQAPVDQAPAEGRLYGTMVTADGREFTGYVAWDVDEIYTTDLLEGDDEDGRRVALEFGSIASISRNDRRSARIVLSTGREMILDGTNDVDSSIRGVAVSDPGLGEVKVGWDAFREVRFHAPEVQEDAAVYDGGRRIRGTVVTRSGEQLSGDVRWDDDEEFSWEMLNGQVGGVEFQVEFGRIARITRQGDGVQVELKDGRTLDVTGSNDVDPGNRGLRVEDSAGRLFRIDWRDFVELRLEQ